jgi:hypothetical protein
VPNERINISVGSDPDTDLQASDARLVDAFVQSNGEIKLLPALSSILKIENIEAIFHSTYFKRLIIVTRSNLYYYLNGELHTVGEIDYYGYAVRIAENVANHICIVTGESAWIFDQQNDTLTKLSAEDHGFDLTNPRDVTTINTLFIVVGGNESKWIISNVNNGFSWDGNEVITTDTSVGELIGVAASNNNLFIFGEGAVQRWVPSILRSVQDFPFTQDPSFQEEYGLTSTNSLISKNNSIFYLSYNGQIRNISAKGRMTINSPGIQSVIDGYAYLSKSRASYFHFHSHWFYHLSFENENTTWVYCVESNKWSESNDIILGNSIAQNKEDVVFLNDGLYNLTDDLSNQYKSVLIQTSPIYLSGDDVEQRVALSKVVLELTQGKNQSSEDDKAFLSLSKDNVVFSPTVSRQFAPIGDRLKKLSWNINFPAPVVTLRLTLHTKSDILIKSCIISF